MSIPLSSSIPDDIGEQLYELARDLFPLNRSITGQGVRDTLERVAKVLPLTVHALATGTKVFDWTIPKEWNLREAYIEDPAGKRIVDTREHNLHVVGYSTPIRKRMMLSELKQHLHTLPDRADWIPYRTSYYKETWGFCLTHRQLQSLEEGEYTACVDATLEPGVLNFAEAVIPGRTKDEFLISAHVCHPSLCNDNLSGIAIAAFFGRLLKEHDLRYTYRILFAPGTIGTIAWLATRREERSRVKLGLVSALLGRPGPLTYKRTRGGSAYIDRVAEQALTERGGDSRVIDFEPWGYDERQFNSPGIALEIGRLSRAAEGGYPEYHTSADNLDLVKPWALEDAFRALCSIVEIVENDGFYENTSPFGEPQLGKYGLYDHVGGGRSVERTRLAMLWTLNLSDGTHGLLEIAQRSRLPFADVAHAADRLIAAGLLRSAERASE